MNPVRENSRVEVNLDETTSTVCIRAIVLAFVDEHVSQRQFESFNEAVRGDVNKTLTNKLTDLFYGKIRDQLVDLRRDIRQAMIQPGFDSAMSIDKKIGEIIMEMM